ncbi:unnamed protein product [marine sediment metagenome]|uniref:Tripartite ATP-independent periplasmic transporters DctQ component domain-containing protein n=1 Tax=marine sediment metagenome TaxID=412755 RepID=X1A1J5_9ZZZZ
MNYISFFVKKMLNIIAIIEDIACRIGMWLCVILVFFGVINRYFLHFPIMWIDDLSVYIFIFYLFISIALTSREDSHLRINVFRNKIFKKNSKADFIYGFFLRIISIIIVIFFIPPTYNFMLRAIKYPEYGTLVPWFNTSWLMYALFFMVILLLIHMFEWLAKDVILIRKLILKGRKQ